MQHREKKDKEIGRKAAFFIERQKCAIKFNLQLEIGGKHCCALANARKTVFAQFGRRGALIAYFPSEMKHDIKRSCFRHWQLFPIFFYRAFANPCMM